MRQDTRLDYALRVFSLAGLSMPSFWLGMVIILGLVAWIGWIPPVTYVRMSENFWLHAVQFMLPALAVGYRSSALIMRITRSSLLEVLREDYVRTARAKGLTRRAVIWRHALKNAILPVVTVIGIEFAFLIGGLVVTETVFNLPGLARFLVQAILWRVIPSCRTWSCSSRSSSSCRISSSTCSTESSTRGCAMAASPLGAGATAVLHGAASPARRLDDARPVLPEKAARCRRRGHHARDPAHRGLRGPAPDL